MSLSVEFKVRLWGAIIGAIIFGALGARLAPLLEGTDGLTVLVSAALLGLLTGLILTPYITTRPLRRIRQSLIAMPSERLLAIILGTFFGLIAALLFAFPLSLLPEPLRQIMPFAAALVFCYLSITVLALRQNDLRALLNSLQPFRTNGDADAAEDQMILLDTSVIIDGRIADVSKTGFIRASLVIPNFVLKELQNIADSPDAIRRNRGRRGLDVLASLQNESPILTKITDMDVTEVRDVDSKLVALGRQLRCPIMTNDYNLNRVAELQGVSVLNINDLANAVKAVYLPGENMAVKIIQEGKEVGQGVGYLDDGTMVVVEDGLNEINNTIRVTVTKVLQTSAGRMIFARP